MDTMQAIITRRAVRNFSDKPVTDETLTKILEVGRAAPSPLNSQPWHFIVVRNKNTIIDVSHHANHGSFLAMAQIVIIVTAEKHAKVDEWLAEHQQHIYSAAGALEYMWLAAWDLGVGGCWVTVDEQHARKTFGIPNTHILIGSLALGYPKELPKEHTSGDRKPLSAEVSYEKFS